MMHANISGNMMLAAIPYLIFPSRPDETKPETAGPREQPMSPARARYAERDALVPSNLSEARLQVPGHSIPVPIPQRPHAASPTAGKGEREAAAKDTAQREAPMPIRGIRLRLLPNFAFKSLAVPQQAAKRQGPKISPAVLLTPRAVSVKLDAHWHMACSVAPANIIIRQKI